MNTMTPEELEALFERPGDKVQTKKHPSRVELEASLEYVPHTQCLLMVPNSKVEMKRLANSLLSSLDIAVKNHHRAMAAYEVLLRDYETLKAQEDQREATAEAIVSLSPFEEKPTCKACGNNKFLHRYSYFLANYGVTCEVPHLHAWCSKCGWGMDMRTKDPT